MTNFTDDHEPDHAPTLQAKMAVHRALAKLAADERRIMILRFYEEEEFKNCAEQMGITYSEARALYKRAARKLSKILQRR